MKVQLIRPPLDEWYQMKQFADLISVPAGLCLLAKTLRGYDAEVEVIDGMYPPLQKEFERAVSKSVREGKPLPDNIDGAYRAMHALIFEQLSERIDADIVGVSELYSTHLNAVNILEEAKKKGAMTVIGGPNVSHLAERVLAKRDYIDYVVVGDGEEALPMLVAGHDPATIPNLVYRKGGSIVKNPRRPAPLRTVFDLDDLVDTHNFDPDRSFPLSSIRGCIKAEKKGRCTFCSIDTKLRVMDPKLVWEQIDILNSRYGINYFFETGDDFMVGNYPQKLLAARPEHLKEIAFRMYGNPTRLDERSIQILQDLNTREVFVGIESFNDDILARANKEYRTADIRRAIDLMAGSGILPHIPLIYGLPGETEETAENTSRFVKQLVARLPDIRLVCSLPIPLPGTDLFENLRNDERARAQYLGDLDKDDFFGYELLVRIQTELYTSVSFDYLVDKIKETKALVRGAGRTTSFSVGMHTNRDFKNF